MSNSLICCRPDKVLQEARCGPWAMFWRPLLREIGELSIIQYMPLYNGNFQDQKRGKLEEEKNPCTLWQKSWPISIVQNSRGTLCLLYFI